MAAVLPLSLGTTLSRKYRVDRFMTDADGVLVYEGTDTARKQRVWIKILQRDSLVNADALERFQVEASGSKVLDVGKSADGLPYLVASDLVTSERPAPVPEAPGPPRPAPRAALAGLKATQKMGRPPPSSASTPVVLADEDVEAVSSRNLTDGPKSISIPRATKTLVLDPAVTDRPRALPPPVHRERREELPAPSPLEFEPPQQAPPAGVRGIEEPVFAQPELPVEEPPVSTPATWRVWLPLLVLVSSATGVGGWLLGRAAHEPLQNVAAQTAAPPAPMAPAETTNKTEAKLAEPPATTPTPTPTPTTTPTTPSAVSVATAEKTHEAAPPPPPPPPTGLPPTAVQTKRTPPAKPPPKTGGSDPLTL